MKNLIIIAIITATATFNATAAKAAAETDTPKQPTQSEITDMVIDELNRREERDREIRGEAALKAGGVKDYFDRQGIKIKNRLEGTDIEIEEPKNERAKKAIETISGAAEWGLKVF